LSKIKLLYITNQICGSGGLERVLSIKSNYLINKFDYEVHIITLNQKDEPLFYEFSDQLIFHDIRVVGNAIHAFMNYKNGLQKVVNTVKPDVISVCDDGLKGFFVPYFLRRNKAIVYERHASKNIFKNKDSSSFIDRLKFKFLEGLMYLGGRKYSSFIVLTNENLKEWKFKNLHVIPNPLSYSEVQKSSLKNKKVISVGNHGFQKGYDRLLQSWKKVSDIHPDWTLEIYGDKKHSKKHYDLAQKLNISDKVAFYEPVKDIQKKYQEASIYTMSSRSEGFGMVLIEAMIHGIPCVSFNCPSGPSDIISNNEDGFLVDNGDIEAMSIKVINLIEDEKLRRIMGEKASKNALRYLPEIIMVEWDNLFKKLIDN